jgi:hypothetical protein
MKIEVLKTVTDSFVDYAGIERKFIVVAVATKTNNLSKSFGIGFSICNPADEFNEEIGKQIAINKALNKENKLAATVNCNGFLTPKIIDALIEQEIAYFKNKPSAHIPGYFEMKEKYEKEEERANKLDTLLRNHGEVVRNVLNFNPEEKELLIKLLNDD